MSARLFAEIDAEDETRARLDADGARHLRARRLVRGDVVHAIVGPGDVRAATIEVIERSHAILRVGERVPSSDADPREPAILAIALGDLARMELVIEKATELGATEIRPFVATRSQVRDVAATRLARWQRIARSACEQCGRTAAPPIAAVMDLPELIAQLPPDAAIALLLPPHALGEERSAAEPIAPRGVTLVLIVGPEGGFTSDEIAMLTSRGAAHVTLGPRVLRFETAAIAGLAALVLAPRRHP